MKIVTYSPPLTGQPFELIVSGGIGKISVQAYVAGQQIYIGGCDDPPCHEMINIPLGSVRNTLLVNVIDSQGNRLEEEFIIEDSDAGSGSIDISAS